MGHVDTTTTHTHLLEAAMLNPIHLYDVTVRSGRELRTVTVPCGVPANAKSVGAAQANLVCPWQGLDALQVGGLDTAEHRAN
jgi:hypothetical protein